jgi:hypothetical protein
MPDRTLPVARILMAGGAYALCIAVAIVVVLVILGARGLPYGGWAVGVPAPPAAAAGELAPMPGPELAQSVAPLQPAPQPELARYLSAKAGGLEELAWADATHTTAHVPIRVAMAMLVARSASAAKTASTAATASVPGAAPTAPPADTGAASAPARESAASGAEEAAR